MKRFGRKEASPEKPVRAKRQSAPIVETVSIDQTSREERMAAIRRAFSRNSSIAREAAIKEVAAELGYNRVGPKIYNNLDGDIKAASRRGIIDRENGLYSLDCRSISDYSRDILKDAFLSVLGRTWKDQTCAIRETASYLGFTRTGGNIQDSLKSAINGLIRQGVIERNGNELRRT